ncbi:hypothetical protein BD413DRAFT_250778 [Trametes elegans]|nr:hypothetical protein BD413DRAFT_250778 [Trametes elegans]
MRRQSLLVPRLLASWSNSTFTDPALGASYVSSVDSLTSASSSMSSPSAHSPKSTATHNTHGPSRTALISLSTALGFLFLIGLLVLVLYLPRRRHRCRHTKDLEPFPHPIRFALADEARLSRSNEDKCVDADAGVSSVQHELLRRASASDASLLVISAPVNSRGAHELASSASGLFPHRGSALAHGESRLQTDQSVSLSPTGEDLSVAANASIDKATGLHDAFRAAGDTGLVGTHSTAFSGLTEDMAKAHVDDSVAYRPSPSQGVDISAVREPTSRPAAPSSHPTAPELYSLAPAFEPPGAAALPSAVSLARRQRFLTVLMDLSEEDTEGFHPPPYYPRISNEARVVNAPGGEAGGE